MKRAPRASTSLAERGATTTIPKTPGRIAAPASRVEYPSTFWTNCWPMNIAPISEPKTMIPASAATQKVGRDATARSYSGLAARRWRSRKAPIIAAARIPSTTAVVPLPGSGARLIARISVPTIPIEMIPPRWSTGSVVSLTCAGTIFHAASRAIAASGAVTMNTEPHANPSSRAPESSGPSADMPPPSADQSAIDLVRCGPDQSAVISARVVG